MNSQMMHITESMSGYTIQSVQVPEFIVEDIQDGIQSLNGGIKKKFTSSASSYAIVFKWDFGDGTTLNTSDRSIVHKYDNPGTYTVKHQACLLDLPCCYVNDIPWCVKTITVGVPVLPNIVPTLVAAGFFGLILLPKRKCEDYDTKKKCGKKPKECQWLEKENKCVPKCQKGYRLEKDETKIPYRYKCKSIETHQKR